MNTSAGKGSKPRAVDKNKWDENYDRIFARRKTIDQWAEHFGDRIKSYDGFRQYNQDDLLTEKEYQNGLTSCTMYVKSFIIQDGSIESFDQPVGNNNLSPWKY